MGNATTIAARGGWLGAATRRPPLGVFFALAYALSWLGWLPLVAHATGSSPPGPRPTGTYSGASGHCWPPAS